MGKVTSTRSTGELRLAFFTMLETLEECEWIEINP